MATVEDCDVDDDHSDAGKGDVMTNDEGTRGGAGRVGVDEGPRCEAWWYKTMNLSMCHAQCFCSPLVF
jgi:hypothetical protein